MKSKSTKAILLSLTALMLSLPGCAPDEAESKSKDSKTESVSNDGSSSMAVKSDKSSKTDKGHSDKNDKTRPNPKNDKKNQPKLDPAAERRKKMSPADLAIRPDALKAKTLLAKGNVVALDLRDPDDFKKGHLDKAVNLDSSEKAAFAKQLKSLDKSKTYLLYDYRSKRSERALKEFKAAGIKNVLILDGGLRAWKKASLPVKK